MYYLALFSNRVKLGTVLIEIVLTGDPLYIPIYIFSISALASKMWSKQKRSWFLLKFPYLHQIPACNFINSVLHHSSHSSFGTGDFDFIFFRKRADVWNPPFMSMQLLPKCYIRWDANVAFTFSNFHIKQHLISLWSYYYNT